MSDARTDFFSSSAGNKKPPPSATRDDFFSGKVDIDKLPAAKETPREFSSDAARQGYGRGGRAPTPETLAAMRDNSGNPLAEVAPGINQGVAHLLGLPVTTLVNAANLTSAGLGFGESLITGEAPSQIFDPVDPARIPLTGAWNEQLLNSTPLGDVTSVRDPSNPVNRVVHAASSGIPGGIVGGGPVVPNVLAGAAGGGAAGVLNEVGADPATQAVGSLLAGAAATRLSPAASPSTPVRAREETPQQKLNEQASSQSMGAAGAAVDLQKLSPELRTAVEKAVRETGGAVNPEAMARQIQADSLPVKVRLSEGQALGDERLISLEQNARGKHEVYSKGFNEQNKALVDNTRAFRDEAGPDVFSTNATEHADTIIGRYKAIDEARNADISQKYEALRDAAGGEFPIDTQTLLTNVRGALKKDLASSKAPADVMGALEEAAAAGTMTLEGFETMRTTLARIQRSAGDGQERHAAGVIRQQIEDMPLQAGADKLKGLADEARSAARDRFQALEADPAYKAAVNDSVTPDAFVQKFIVNGARDNVALLSDAMKGDERALQTVRVATLDHLRKAAGIDASYNGNFSQAAYNKALQSLDPKLVSLLDPNLAEQVRTLGDVARYTQFQPRGSFVNNSNTTVAQEALKHGADVLEGVANMKAGGIPVGSYIRNKVNEGKVAKRAAQTFAPGAGLTKLSDLTKVKKP